VAANGAGGSSTITTFIAGYVGLGGDAGTFHILGGNGGRGADECGASVAAGGGGGPGGDVAPVTCDPGEGATPGSGATTTNDGVGNGGHGGAGSPGGVGGQKALFQTDDPSIVPTVLAPSFMNGLNGSGCSTGTTPQPFAYSITTSAASQLLAAYSGT